ncbi:hypothetical protein CC80DRAFT_502449 [Byssothecium circinans]|uniref:Uncharacterized protein n=1 Tax=Byssothecium circinans TaxID=147558 RepID=A0A6A5U439_9PLEO|nr:hypothetical protein CC80DRAFT_502449 [Byssothecium circinans]
MSRKRALDNLDSSRTRDSTAADGAFIARSVHKKSTERNLTDSPLLRLAPELRNRFYYYALNGLRIEPVYSAGATFKRVEAYAEPGPHSHRVSIKQRIEPSTLMSLSKVCRQLHKDTEIIPFELNVFHGSPAKPDYYSSSVLYPWTGTSMFHPWTNPSFLNPDQRKAIATVSTSPSFGCGNFGAEIRKLSGLKTVIIQSVYMSNFRASSLQSINETIKRFINLSSRNDLEIHYVLDHLQKTDSDTDCRRMFKWKNGKLDEIEVFNYATSTTTEIYRKNEAEEWHEADTGEEYQHYGSKY